MRLCMFHPVGQPMERGWVGRVEGKRVIQLAAQTLQSFFTGGGTAREHAEYGLKDVVLLAPVLHPPSVRLFDDARSFTFANPAAIVGPGATITPPSSTVSPGRLNAHSRIAAVIGADGAIGGFTGLVEWRARGIPPPKDRDFALGLGPVVVTTAPVSSGFDWAATIAFAAAGTVLHPGDLVAGPALERTEGVEAGAVISIELDGIGVLEQRVAG